MSDPKCKHGFEPDEGCGACAEITALQHSLATAERELAELRRELKAAQPLINASIALELLNMGHYHEAHDGAEQFVDAVNRYMAHNPSRGES